MHRSPQTTLVPAFVAALAAAVVYVSPSPAAGATFRGLGDLAGGNFSSGANGVSADGCAVVGVGASASGSEAFHWTLESGMIGLGDLPGGNVSSGAWNASADGHVVVGTSASAGGAEAFRWTAATGMIGLGDLPGGVEFSVAHGVSADGNVIVGYGHTAAGQEGFRWTPSTGLVGLGDFAGGDSYSAAAGITGDGRVIVGLGSSPAGIEAFRWTATAGLVGLGDVPGGAYFSGANGVAADGSMVVGVDYSNLPGEAFVWSAAGGIHSLGLLPDAAKYDTSQAYDISVLGHVVAGTASAPGEGNVAVVWDAAHGFRRVQDLLVSAGVDMAGWRLTEATGISDNGQIVVGRGYNPQGLAEAWMAIVPPLANQADPGDVNNDGRVDRGDLSTMLTNFGARCGVGFYEGDLNADGNVSLFDVIVWSEHAGTVYAATPPAAVPEPASTTLVLAGLLALAARRAIRRQFTIARP